MTETDKLLICAKAVDLDAEYFVSTKKIITEDGQEYNPLTNDAQAFELLRWLCDQPEDELLPIEHVIDSWYIEFTSEDGKHVEVKAKTLNEAIVNAVVVIQEKE